MADEAFAIGPAPSRESYLRIDRILEVARRLAVEAGVPVVPGTLAPLDDLDLLRGEAERIGLPIMIKAAAGGGGKGLRLVRDASLLAAAAERARSEALSAFGDGR